jgi:non-specific serine/threonine protein kinase
MADRAPAGTVFISHSSHDHEEAAQVVTALEAAGVPCWIAPRDIPPGAEWAPTIVAALHGSSALLLLLTAASNESPQVLREVERAVALRLPILAVRREAVSLAPSLQFFLGVGHWLDATGGAPLGPYLTDLVGRVQAMRDGRAADGGGPVNGASSHTSALRAARPGNLPVPTADLVGREADVAALTGMLSSADSAKGVRLVTVTGAGGSGKTRLALEAARALQRHSPDPFPDGAFFADLTPVAGPDRVAAAVAAAAGVRDSGERPPAEALADALRRRRALLVLDNCEHVVAACAALVGSLLRACPGVRVLATSRERLGVAGEHVYPLAPLPVPAEGTARAADVLHSPSVRLFAERATAVNPAFALTDENAAAVAELCRRLDGLPLAIELAAARARSLSPRQITERLSQRFRLLTGGSRDAPAHQQTLRSLIDWSYDLLSDGEKALLRRLSVFAGGGTGFSLEAAEDVGADGDLVSDWEVLDLLSSLADKSLVTPEAPRYRLLETVREYAAERLEEGGDGAAVRARHTAYFVRLAATLGEDLNGPDAPDRLNRLEADRANLLLALDRALEGEAPDVESALNLCRGLSVFWKVRGRLREGRDAMLRTLAAADAAGLTDSDTRAFVTTGAALCALYLNRNDEAVGLMRDALEQRRRIGDPDGVADALFNLGAVYGESGRMDECEAALVEGLAVCRPGSRTQMGLLGNLGIVRLYRGDLAGAEGPVTEALALNRAAGVRQGEAISQMFLARIALRARGDQDAARGHLRESLRLFRELHHRRGVASALACFAEVAVAAGEWDNGARLYGAHDALLEALDSSVNGAERPAYERDLAVLRERLGDAFEAAYAAGRALGEEDACTLALGEAA